MIDLIDFSDFELSSRDLEYGGRSGDKRGIVYNGEYWFLKFPKNASKMKNVKELSYTTSSLSEYIGSQVYQIMGFDVHETKLGICFDGKRKKIVCACKDFIKNQAEEKLIKYTSLRNDTNPVLMERKDSSTSLSASNLDEIIFQLDNNRLLKTIPNLKKHFWDMVLVDILINNNDRNEDNWGLIKNLNTGQYRLAPVYDNGNSFYGKAAESKVEALLVDEERLKSSSLNLITAFEKDTDIRYQIGEIVKLVNEDLQNELVKICTLYENNRLTIKKMIDDLPETYENQIVMSKERKYYYFKSMEYRYSELLKPQLESIKNERIRN